MALEELQNGRYRRLRLLGSGSMGDVYLMEDTRINRHVAIKVIRTEAIPYPDSDAARDAVRLFQREARAIAALEHPHILPLYDFGEEQHQNTTFTYMVMRFCPDGSLANWLRERSSSVLPSPQDVAELITQAANALQYAHNHRIIHQDVKPANFLIQHDEDNPHRPHLLLADFGVAKLSTSTSSSSLTIRGTPSSMAPEQWSGTPVPASDQYALAVMSYELLTGRPPFLGNLQQMMYQHFHAQPPAPSTSNPHLPAAIDDVLLHALAKNPEERFPSISDFASALQQATQDMPSSVSPGPVPSRYTPPIPPTIVAKGTPYIANERDIRATLRISQEEARTGVVRQVTLAGGQNVRVVVPAGAYDGQVIRLEGQREPGHDGGPTGALILTIAVADIEPILPPPPPPLSRSLRQKLLLVGLVGLALLVIGGSSAGFFIIRNNQIASDNAHATVTAQATIHARLTATTYARLTATAQVQATANAIESNPYGGTLILDDPLHDNSKGNGWDEITNSDGSFCKFKEGTYHAYQKDLQYLHICFAQNTNFSNFTYEVKMTVLNGNCGGLIFRAGSSSYYVFDVCQDGTFSLFSSANGSVYLLGPQNSSTIKTGLNQSNLITVVAYHDFIYLYANRQFIMSTQDSTYDHGRIGIITYPSNTPTEVAYSDLRLWIW